MSRDALSDADVQAILKLLAEAEHVIEFRLRYGDVVIELCKAQHGAQQVLHAKRADGVDGPPSDSAAYAQADVAPVGAAGRGALS